MTAAVRIRTSRGSIPTIAALALLALYVICAVVGLWATPYPPGQSGVGTPSAPPSPDHWFGTDRLGRDVFSRVLAATALDLTIVMVVVASSLVLGSMLGTLAGFFGGAADTAVLRTVEVVQAFPQLLLAILIAQWTGPGVASTALILVAVGTPFYIRLARQGVLERRALAYAEAARLSGASRLEVAFGHVLPNAIGPLLANSAIHATWVVLSVAGLGFLGVGLPPGTPEWGTLIADGQSSVVAGHWWIPLFPGLAIVGLAIAFYLLADGIADRFDPRSRDRRV